MSAAAHARMAFGRALFAAIDTQVTRASTPMLVLASDRADGWPEHVPDQLSGAIKNITCRYLPLADALTTRYRTDAHLAAYSVPAIARRLADESVFATLAARGIDGVTMVALIVDVDGKDHAADDDWRTTERAKVERLLADHPDGFVYDTRGGYRIVYVLAEPHVIRSRRDADRWSAWYLATLAYIKITHDIVGDPACHDWTRLYRLPHATRLVGDVAEPQDLDVIGDARAIGAWDVEVTVPEPAPVPLRAPSGVVSRGGASCEDLVRAWCPGVQPRSDSGGVAYDIECPWEHEHTAKSGKRSTTVWIGSDGGAKFSCLHTHCAGREWADLRRWHEPTWQPYDPSAPKRSARTDEPNAREDSTMSDDERPFTDESDMSDEDRAAYEAEARGDVPPPGDADAPAARGRGPGRPSTATVLVGLALAEAELWHVPDGEAYATITVDGHREHHRLTSSACRQWLARLYYRARGAAAGREAISTAVTTLAGIALHDGTEHAVHVRVAELDGRVYLDLADDRWRAIEISAGGWRLVDEPPVRFARSGGMLALPEPHYGGTIADLRRHVRIADDSWPLVLGWLTGAMSPRGPYPVLVLRAQHGAGKSWLARILRSLIDPSVAPIRAEPREPRDLIVAARASHVIALDNLSSVPSWLSDGLCRLATGGGYSARTLYTDADETIIDVQRPTILTGITDVVTAPDLLDRSLLVELEPMPDDARQPEAELLAAWTEAQPRILGALCTALAHALGRRSQIRLDRLPRMADWAQLATAAEPALELADGAVIAALAAQADEAHEIAIDASPIARQVIDLIESRVSGEWTGTAAALLTELGSRAGESVTRHTTWPRTARGLSGMLARIAPALRARGISAERMRRGSAAGLRGERAWTIMKGGDGW